MKCYDYSKPSKNIMFLNANNLYGWVNSQYLPQSDFKWLNQKYIDKFDLNFIKKIINMDTYQKLILNT